MTVEDENVVVLTGVDAERVWAMATADQTGSLELRLRKGAVEYAALKRAAREPMSKRPKDDWIAGPGDPERWARADRHGSDVKAARKLCTHKLSAGPPYVHTNSAFDQFLVTFS